MPLQEKERLGRARAPAEPHFGGNLARSGFPGSAALRAFESAGRLLSFKRAAQEVKLTESAISFQIRQLERDLGIDLFERGHHLRHPSVILSRGEIRRVVDDDDMPLDRASRDSCQLFDDRMCLAA